MVYGVLVVMIGGISSMTDGLFTRWDDLTIQRVTDSRNKNDAGMVRPPKVIECGKCRGKGTNRQGWTCKKCHGSGTIILTNGGKH